MMTRGKGAHRSCAARIPTPIGMGIVALPIAYAVVSLAVVYGAYAVFALFGLLASAFREPTVRSGQDLAAFLVLALCAVALLLACSAALYGVRRVMRWSHKKWRAR